MGPMRCSLVLISLASAISVRNAAAQAVVGDQGSLSASLSHNFGFADKIIQSGGAEYPNQYVHSQTTMIGVEYVPIDKLAIGIGVPLVAIKYDDEKSGTDFDPHGPHDDGNYHFTLQDLKADVRYMVLP